MEYTKALVIAKKVKELISPYCYRAEIAGSIRRKKLEVKDIEIVAIPKPFETGLFESGIATIINKWQKVKGELPCKYTQRVLLEGIKLDLFFATRENWGLIYAIRTGSSSYSHKVLGYNWKKRGYTSKEGNLYFKNNRVNVLEERDLFNRIGVKYIGPEWRR